LNFIRNFWGCPCFRYVPLENDGGDSTVGSHWERAALFNEVMIGSEIKDSVFSGLTFTLLKDIGWYGFDEVNFENFYAGKGMGCDWLKICHFP
jgi:leishmanolysin